MRTTVAEYFFWVATAVVGYAFAFYPLIMAATARINAKPKASQIDYSGSYSVVLAAFNEEAVIQRRVAEIVALIHDFGRVGEIVVVSDGSTDSTVSVVKKFDSRLVKLVEICENVGKAEALSRGCATAAGEVFVFADARQRWDRATLRTLLAPFGDGAVGAVGGELILESKPGLLSGVGLYWRYEKWLRRNESAVHSTVGVSGSISAVRRELFRPIPAGTLLDDVYWPLQVTMQRRRVLYAPGAYAYDRLPDGVEGEFRRKVRTLSGNFQLLVRLPGALAPWRNPIWLQYVSHKVTRLIVPWALIAMFFASPLIPGILYRVMFACQLAAYGVGLGALLIPRFATFRIGSAAASFIVLNSAAWVAFWVWLSGSSGLVWRKVSYGGVGTSKHPHEGITPKITAPTHPNLTKTARSSDLSAD